MDKIQSLSEELGIQVQAFVATELDHYSKPATGLWDLMKDQFNSNVLISLSESFYVGDEAGRIAGMAHRKDYSCMDRKFAHNLGIKFYTESEFFLEKVSQPWTWMDDEELDQFLRSPDSDYTLLNDSRKNVTAEQQEMIILCGPPTSGKSTFANRYLIPAGYIGITKSFPACHLDLTRALGNGSSVVIDNTNSDKKSRRIFIDEAKEYLVPVRCFLFKTPLSVAKHLNLFRVKLTRGQAKIVLDIAYKAHTSRFQLPTQEEGFTEVKEIRFRPIFEKEDDAILFYQRT